MPRKSTEYRTRYGRVIRTLRLVIKNKPGMFARVAKIIGDAGIHIGDVTRIRVDQKYTVRDVAIMADNEDEINPLVGTIESISGVKVADIIIDALEIRRGGLLKSAITRKVATIEDFHTVIMPGVYEACEYLGKNPKDVGKFTGKKTNVAIISNGTQMPGANREVPEACLPLLEAKGLVLHQLTDLSVSPVVVGIDESYGFVNIATHIAKTFGAIILTGIAHPNCFEVVERLENALPIPVFHDDSDGVAVTVLGSVIASLKRVRKNAADASVVIGGCGVAGHAIAKLLIAYGIDDVIVVDRNGAIYKGRSSDDGTYKQHVGEITNSYFQKGKLKDIIKGKDVFVGVSKAGTLNARMIKSMAKNPIVLALSVPMPEITPEAAYEAGAAVALDAHTCSTAISYPGIIQGAIEASSENITEDMKVAAAEAIAECAKKVDDVVPLMFDTDVHREIANAVRKVAMKK